MAPAHFAARDDEHIPALDSKLGTVVRCADAHRLQREPADVCANAPGAPDRTDRVAVDVDAIDGCRGGCRGIRSDADHTFTSRGAIRGSTIASRARR